jgi:hypothetical protein
MKNKLKINTIIVYDNEDRNITDCDEWESF